MLNEGDEKGAVWSGLAVKVGVGGKDGDDETQTVLEGE